MGSCSKSDNADGRLAGVAAERWLATLGWASFRPLVSIANIVPPFQFMTAAVQSGASSRSGSTSGSLVAGLMPHDLSQFGAEMGLAVHPSEGIGAVVAVFRGLRQTWRRNETHHVRRTDHDVLAVWQDFSEQSCQCRDTQP
jgi:hypothetical protein